MNTRLFLFIGGLAEFTAFLIVFVSALKCIPFVYGYFEALYPGEKYEPLLLLYAVIGFHLIAGAAFVAMFFGAAIWVYLALGLNAISKIEALKSVELLVSKGDEPAWGCGFSFYAWVLKRAT